MKNFRIRWQLVFYDLVVFLTIECLLLIVYRKDALPLLQLWRQMLLSFVCIFATRVIGRIYQLIWRYGGIQSYIRLLFADGVAFLINLGAMQLLPIHPIAASRLLAMACLNLLGSLVMRMMYRYAYKCANTDTRRGRILDRLLRVFAGSKIHGEAQNHAHRIKIAIIGAGRGGVSLAEELMTNVTAAYIPLCFVDTNKDKVNRSIHGIPVLYENEDIFERLRSMDIQEVVFTLPSPDETYRKELCERYWKAGYRIKVYDYPVVQNADGKRHLRRFDMEDLLFRRQIDMRDTGTNAYYRDKVILITGGGGSIGSELCRRLAKLQPRCIIVLDIYENGAYDVQQELKMAYGDTPDVQVEIVSINNLGGMRRVFEDHRPQIVIHAAAHKHVPLMEKNCIEAVENNVFGTEVLVRLCEEFGTERFMMVSTDKAVNPTNVMGATKRMCEMIVLSAATQGRVTYSATRFGNVLGSAGSVIPLFKRQIASGGPLTITDKRIIRYFMTIPEAAQLVLQSGAMAENGELFVLDMGEPVKILDLAQNMIRLSGASDIEIVETGLRPGEKLYEELLIRTEELDKTDNNLIYIERDTPCTPREIEEKLAILRDACATGDDELVREALRTVVPTYRRPEELNTAGTVEENQHRAIPCVAVNS